MSAAAKHILSLLRRDPRLAYLIGPGSQSFDLLIEEEAFRQNVAPEVLRAKVESTLQITPWPRDDDDASPSWISFDVMADALTINGKRYAAVMFGANGFMSPPGTLLRIVEGADDVVTVQQVPTPAFNLAAHLHRQREFSLRTFGPGARTAGVVDHIRKELVEVLAAPHDLSEWADVIIPAFDGALRAGGSPELIIEAIVDKQTRNEGRVWPDWCTMPADKAIEHDRSGDATEACVRGLRNVIAEDRGPVQ